MILNSHEFVKSIHIYKHVWTNTKMGFCTGTTTGAPTRHIMPEWKLSCTKGVLCTFFFLSTSERSIFSSPCKYQCKPRHKLQHNNVLQSLMIQEVIITDFFIDRCEWIYFDNYLCISLYFFIPWACENALKCCSKPNVEFIYFNRVFFLQNW